MGAAEFFFAAVDSSSHHDIVSTNDLEPYTLLIADDLMVIQATNETLDPDASKDPRNELINRYLLAEVPQGMEVKSEMLAPAEAKALLDNSIAVSIPATATLTLGNQLQVGDMIDLLAIPSNQPPPNQSDKPKPPAFELLVLNVPVKKDLKVDEKNSEAGAITLALARDKRDEFAAAIAGATLMITRRVPVKVSAQKP